MVVSLGAAFRVYIVCARLAFVTFGRSIFFPALHKQANSELIIQVSENTATYPMEPVLLSSLVL
jgi:hypothetical protein